MSELTPEDASSTFAATPPLESLKVMLSRCMTGKRRAPAEEKVLGFHDISRAHFHCPARRTIVIKVSKPFLSGLRSKCLSDFVVARHGVASVRWHWLDTQSRLEVVGDPWPQSGLDFGTAEIQYLLYILNIDEEHHANFESICWYLPSPSESPASFSDEC